MEITFAREG